MSGKLLSRNVTIGGRRTSLRLEHGMWSALIEVCEREGATLHVLCTEIDKRRDKGTSRTSAVRSFIVEYFRAAATESGHGRAGHGKKTTVRKRKTEDDLSNLFRS